MFIGRLPLSCRYSTRVSIVTVSTALTHEEVARIARLARLALTPDETTLFARQLAGILSYAEQIREIDTAGIPPTSHVAAPSRLREDDVRPSLGRDEVVASAAGADAAAGLFKVPRVLGK
jgi:aspartyl-tRNA(Asn)/glutamyl-tRNA(Gln) amidotransferase subunit C